MVVVVPGLIVFFQMKLIIEIDYEQDCHVGGVTGKQMPQRMKLKHRFKQDHNCVEQHQFHTRLFGRDIVQAKEAIDGGAVHLQIRAEFVVQIP